MGWREISEQMGIPATSCEYKYRSRGLGSPSPYFSNDERPKLGDALLVERELRSIASMSRDLTAATFGDPPPGYSALDEINRRARA